MFGLENRDSRVIVLQMEYFMIQMCKRVFSADSGNTLSKRDFKGIYSILMLSSGTQQKRIHEHMRNFFLTNTLAVVSGVLQAVLLHLLLFVFLGGNVLG